MSNPSFMDFLEEVLYGMGLRTFDPPVTLDYRFGSIPAENGIFRCFVNEEDVVQEPNYLEIRGDQVFFVALEYPGLKEFMDQIHHITNLCFKTLGRMHTANFILALENGLDPSEHELLMNTFQTFKNDLPVGTYHTLKIWDQDEILRLRESLSPCDDAE